MIRHLLLMLSLTFLFTSNLLASQSVITESDGYSCMGDDKSRKETEQAAVNDAKRKATEYAATYIRSETRVKDLALEKDLLNAYAHAQVKVIRELEKGWYKDAASGDCYRAKLQLEVIPDEKSMAAVTARNQGLLEIEPTAPLSVRVWTDKQEYRQGQKIRIYLKSNKPFYGRVVYKDAADSVVQLLPNPYRQDNYFNGGVVYELPSGEDRFELEVAPPFGSEGITVYAGTAPLGEVETATAGSVYAIKTKPQEIGAGTRGLKIVAKESALAPATAEFAEAAAIVKTRK
jgi:hypothetical protein